MNAMKSEIDSIATSIVTVTSPIFLEDALLTAVDSRSIITLEPMKTRHIVFRPLSE